jgi:signal transduction histidine kinase
MASTALVAALIFSLTLTRPVKALTATIRRMGKGDLSARVNIRTTGEMAELAESYNAMAEKIENFDRSRSQFVSNASHELKTPLTAMKLLLECLIDQPEMPDELKMEFMHDMNHEIDRLSGIITDLLTLTKMDSEETAIKHEKFDFTELCIGAVHALQPAAEKNRLTLTMDVAKDVTLQGDESKLGQVIYNLIDNAVKFCPEKGTLGLKIREGGNKAYISISNDGDTIPPEELPLVFDRFHKLDKSRSKNQDGWGLGLYIVKTIVCSHGENISVTSRDGKTEFTFTLPLVN